MSVEKVRIGVIGLGIGRSHIVGFSKAQHGEVVAICDVDAQRLQRTGDEFGIQWRVNDYRELLASPKIDAVVVALPNVMHAPITIAALQAGKHVLCEKPMARTAAEAEQMLAAATQANRQIMIDFSYRFTPPAMALHRFAEAGDLGEIYHARSWWHRNRGIPGLGGWFTSKEKAGGGPLIDLGVHRLDLALWLMGYPKAVSVSGATYGTFGRALAEQQGKSYDVEDLASAFIRFENGATMILEASWAGNSEEREEMLTHIYGTRAGIIHRNVGGGYDFECRIFREEHGSYVSVTPRIYPSDLESAQEHFAHCLIEGKKPMGGGEEGLAVMRLLDAIYLSAARGEEVRL